MNRRELLKYFLVAAGASFSGSLAQNVLAGVVPTRTASKAIFDAATSKKVALLTEMIIPETDTPGAIKAGVPQFVEMMVVDWFNDDERKIFLDGLASLDAYCEQQFGKPFVQCAAEQQLSALQDAEAQAKSYRTFGIAGFGTDLQSKSVDYKTPFFTKLKELTVLGYYTSEVGAQTELVYDPMPMQYEGDYDFAKVGKQWSW